MVKIPKDRNLYRILSGLPPVQYTMKPPYYISDMVAAYDMEIESLNLERKRLTEIIRYTSNDKTRAATALKLAKIAERIAALNEKIDKLSIKYNIT